MSGTSEYWYKKKEIPEIERNKIKAIVHGERAGAFEIDGRSRILLKVGGDIFKEAFIKNRQFLYRGDYTAPPEENDYSDAANYLSEDGLAGFSITDEGWLVSLFSNYRTGGFARAVKKYVVDAAYKLVCIVADTDDGNRLVELYRRLYGFRKYAATINDIEVMRLHYGDEFIENFVLKNGTPFHIFMIGENAVGEAGSIKRFDDYFEAEAYVEKSVALIKTKEI